MAAVTLSPNPHCRMLIVPLPHLMTLARVTTLLPFFHSLVASTRSSRPHSSPLSPSTLLPHPQLALLSPSHLTPSPHISLLSPPALSTRCHPSLRAGQGVRLPHHPGTPHQPDHGAGHQGLPWAPQHCRAAQRSRQSRGRGAGHAGQPCFTPAPSCPARMRHTAMPMLHGAACNKPILYGAACSVQWGAQQGAQQAHAEDPWEGSPEGTCMARHWASALQQLLPRSFCMCSVSSVLGTAARSVTPAVLCSCGTVPHCSP
jgi:hypothetical protein